MTTVLAGVGFPYPVFGILILVLWALATDAFYKYVKNPFKH
jgi:hypothetical protein